MKGIRGRIIASFSLLVASVYGGGGIDGGEIRVPISSRSPGESLFSDGILWDLSPQGKSSSEVMPPKVSCTEEGIFPVTGSCHEFYYCQDFSSQGLKDWYVHWFKCPEGKVFDADSHSCVPSSSVTGRPECQQEQQGLLHEKVDDLINDVLVPEDLIERDAGDNTQLSAELLMSRDSSDQDEAEPRGSDGFSGLHQIPHREKRYVTNLETRIESSTLRKADIVAKSASETCLDVENIDNYISQISSKSPLEISTGSEEMYTMIMKQYNADLRNAQHNTKSWEGEILAAIKETFFLTMEFEPKFSKRFQKLTARVAAVLESDEVKIEELKTMLDETREIIKKTEETLKKTVNRKVNKFVKQHMENTLMKQQKEYNRLLIEYNKARKETEFEELTEILEYVKNNSIEIQEKVEDTRIKMENFQEKIIIDSSKFDRNRELAEEEIKMIEERRDTNNKEIARANTNKVSLRGQISQENNKVRRLNQQLEASKDDLRREVRRLERAAASAKDKQILGGLLLIIPIAGWIAGGIILGQGVSERNAALRQKQIVIDNYYSQVTIHERQVDRLNSQIEAADGRIARLEATSRALQGELPYFRKVDDNLLNMKNNVDSILPFIEKARASLERMKEMFLETERDLDKVIDQAGSAHTKAQKRLVGYFIYFIIDRDITQHWENARDKIISVGKCVTTE